MGGMNQGIQNLRPAPSPDLASLQPAFHSRGRSMPPPQFSLLHSSGQPTLFIWETCIPIPIQYLNSRLPVYPINGKPIQVESPAGDRNTLARLSSFCNTIKTANGRGEQRIFIIRIIVNSSRVWR